jgi:phosphatidylethanolamine-binding protein (PEBP) family uncharacterized protein
MTIPILKASAAAAGLAAIVAGGALAQSAFVLMPTWDGITACSGRPGSSPSPRFRIANAPAGTVQIEFRMTDLDAPRFAHGGGTVAYAGGTEIAAGAFTFMGPCPPEPHRYEWSATARDAAGKSLGTTKAVLKYP